jgi:hypothetical protein
VTRISHALATAAAGGSQDERQVRANADLVMQAIGRADP